MVPGMMKPREPSLWETVKKWKATHSLLLSMQQAPQLSLHPVPEAE